MNTDRTAKPDLTRESSTEEGPGGGEEATESEPGRVAPVHVSDGLAVRRASDDIWCAGPNRVDSTRLTGVAALPAAEHSAGHFFSDGPTAKSGYGHPWPPCAGQLGLISHKCRLDSARLWYTVLDRSHEAPAATDLRRALPPCGLFLEGG